MSKEEIESLMWEYCHEKESDSIEGLHVCHDFKMWMADKLMESYYASVDAKMPDPPPRIGTLTLEERIKMTNTK